MLLENKNETMSEEDKLRMKLWETRYGKGKPRKDMFVGYLMNLKYIVESGSMDLGGRKKKLAIEAILGLNLYEFERKPKTQQEIIFLRVKKAHAENILRLVQEDVALLLLFLEWDSCQMKALQERSLNK